MNFPDDFPGNPHWQKDVAKCEFFVAVVSDHGPLTISNDLRDRIGYARRLNKPFIVALEEGLDESKVLGEFEGCTVAGFFKFSMGENFSGKIAGVASMWADRRN
jgi:predicted AlkP superfamily pyrophosphatase or phosphodiesterase